MLLPVLFVIVAALFATAAQRVGQRDGGAPAARRATPPTSPAASPAWPRSRCISWLELPPVVWFGVAFVSALPLIITAEPDGRGRAPGLVWIGLAIVLLGGSLDLIHLMGRNAYWSPYYKITVSQQGDEAVVEVNNIFHQSMAPVEHKEYFYQWPYAVFGDTFDNVLILGAGSGTDVAAALRHGARHVDAVEIDPLIIRIGRERHPDHPYSDPRVTVINDDARHFLRTTRKKYDLVVFALIDSLTMQSTFSGVRLESYMFTEESFRAVREHLVAQRRAGDLQLLPRAMAGRPAREHGRGGVRRRAARPRARGASLSGRVDGGTAAENADATSREVPDRVTAYGQSHDPSPARTLRAGSVDRAGDGRLALSLHEGARAAARTT